MAPVPEDGNHGDENSQDRDGERNLGERFAILVGFLKLLAEFLGFGGFHVGDFSLSQKIMLSRIFINRVFIGDKRVFYRNAEFSTSRKVASGASRC